MDWDKNITQRQWMVVFIMLVVWLSFSVGAYWYFQKQCSMAKENPLTYVAERYDISSCSCFTNTGDNLFFNKERAWIEKREQPNLKDINFSFEGKEE